MIEDLATLGPFAQDALWAAFVVFLRVGAMTSLLPVFGEKSVPLRVRLGLAVAFTLVVLPAIAPAIGPPPLRSGLALGMIGVETLVGLLFGIMVRLFVLALLMAGAIAAQSTSLSQLFGGSAGGEPSPAIGHLLVSGGLALAAVLGLHVHLAAYMIGSYTLVPPGILPSAQTVIAAGLGEVARAISLAFSLAAPFVIAALLYNIMLGIINRAMPQLMVTFVGAPALTAGGLLLLVGAVPLMLETWSGAFFAFMSAPFGPLP